MWPRKVSSVARSVEIASKLTAIMRRQPRGPINTGWNVRARRDAPNHIGDKSRVLYRDASFTMPCHPEKKPHSRRCCGHPHGSAAEGRSELGWARAARASENRTLYYWHSLNHPCGGFGSSNIPSEVGYVGGRVRAPRKWAMDDVSPTCAFHKGGARK